MTAVPRLRGRDIEAALQQIGSRTRNLYAIYGTGEEQELRLENEAPLRVLPVRSELDLRAHMPALTEADPRIVFLVPWTTDIPLDLAGRFARDGRVTQVGRQTQLKKLFQVPLVAPELENHPLSQWLLEQADERPYAVREQQLTEATAWGHWLARHWHLPAESGLGLDDLLGWAALDAGGPKFVAEHTGPLRDRLLAHLETTLGPAAPPVWRAWEVGAGRVGLELALLFEVIAREPSEVASLWLHERLKSDLPVPEPRRLEAARALGAAAGTALRYVETRARKEAALVRSLLKGAEARADNPSIRQALFASARLPLGFEARLDALGDSLQRGANNIGAAAAGSDRARTVGAESIDDAVAKLRLLEGHTLWDEEENVRRVEHAQMASRLLAWLAHEKSRVVHAETSPFADAENLASWYATEGGYVDWARRAARITADTAFARGVNAVLHGADELRSVLDRRFARSAAEWLSAGRPATRMIPIDSALERVAARFLDGNPTRRLLVLLMDGMAWAQAVELLQSLANRDMAPLTWHATTGRIGSAAYPPVLAAFPTVTEISRSAFFQSKLVPSGRQEDTQKDRERFRENKLLRKYFAEHEAPTLLLRAEGQSSHGGASEEARRLVADPNRRVVGVVINAIDDALKGNPATRHPWTVDKIASLDELLQEARAAGRTVLLASDHGHVPADRLTSRGDMAGGGARWRPLHGEDKAQDFEVELSGPNVWAPKGARAVALMADDTSRWGGSTHSGEHGGASLAEVIAPCVLVAASELQEDHADEGLQVRPPLAPSWWSYGTPVGAVKPEPTRAPPPPLAKQLTLLPEKTPTPIPPPRKKSSRQLVAASPFARSMILAALVPDVKRRAEVIKAVDFLIARNGEAAASAFAGEMGKLPRQAAGFVDELRTTLNVDGFQVLRFDRASAQSVLGDRVILDRNLLDTVFEIPR